MDDRKERFNSAFEILKDIILELDEKDLPTDVVLVVAFSVQHLLKLTVDVISHHQCLLDSVQLRSSCKSLDSSTVFGLDEFVCRLVSEHSQNEVAALPGFVSNCSLKSVFDDCVLDTGFIPKVENNPRSKSCDNALFEASVAMIDGIKTEVEAPGDLGNSDLFLCTELWDSEAASQDQCTINTEKVAKEIVGPAGKRNRQLVCSSMKRKLQKTCSKTRNKSVLQQSSLTPCTVLDEKKPNKSSRLKSTTKHKASKASNCLNFVFFQCFLCNSDVIYESFNMLTRHILSVHTSQKTGGLKILQCPRSAEGCCWTKSTKSAISQTVLAQVLSHLVSEHKIPLPNYLSPYHCGYVECNYESFWKYERDSHQTKHQTEAKVECEDCCALIKTQSLALHQKHCKAAVLKVALLPCMRRGCSKRFRSRKSLKRHIETIHRSAKKFICFRCRRNFCSKCDYYQHVFSQHGENMTNRPVVHCPICNFSAVTMSLMRRHVAGAHPNVFNIVKAMKQVKMDNSSDFKDTGLEPTESSLMSGDFAVPVRGGTALVELTETNFNNCSNEEIMKSLVPDRNQAIAMMEVDEETELEEEEEGNESQVMENKSNIIRFLRFQCFLCLVSDTVFETSSALFSHVRDTHLTKDAGVNVLACPYCGDKKIVQKGVCSSQLSRLLSHMVKKHKCGIPDYIDPFHCPEPNCSFFSIRRYELNTHAQKHRKPEDKVPCEKCGKFMQQRSLATHAKFCSAATGSRPLFSCSLCDKVMSTKQGLQKHFQTKHENRRDFLCSECTRTFGGKGELEDHAFRRHGVNISNKPVYACQQCKFATIIPFSLKRHISEVHSDTRQHQCTVCNKFFKSKLQLKSHKVAHEEKTHRCLMCDYTAARKSNLDAHVKAQHSGVQYKCEDCGYHTGYYANLCKHQRLTCGRSRNYQHTNSVNASSSGGSFNAFLTHGNVF